MENRIDQKSPPQEPASAPRTTSVPSETIPVGQDSRVETTASNVRSGGELRAEIESRLGYFPPPLVPALTNPAVLASLWDQMRSGYLDNPLPPVLKEKLQARLARYCSVSYPIVSHATALRQLGLSAREVLELLNIQAPVAEGELEQFLQEFEAAASPIAAWPKHNTLHEKGLLHCALYLFVRPGRSIRVQCAVAKFIGSASYAHLIAFLAYLKSYHLLIESNSGPPVESVPRIWDKFLLMLREEPRLAKVFRDYRQNFVDRRTGEKVDTIQLPPAELESKLNKTSAELAKAIEILKDEIPRRKQIEREMLACQLRFGELLESTSDIVVGFDLLGNILSLNKAGERLTGYTHDEAARLNITQLAAPECAETTLRMLDTQSCAETPLTYQLSIVTKSGSKVSLDVRQRLICRQKKTAEFQAIARSAGSPADGLAANDSQDQALAELEERVKKKMADLVKANENLQAQLAEQTRTEAALRATLAETSARSVEVFKAYSSLQVQVAKHDNEMPRGRERQNPSSDS